MEAACGDPGHGSAVTVADDADFLGSGAAGEFNCGGDIGQRQVWNEFLYKAPGGLHIGAFVRELDARFDAVKEGWSDGEEAVFRVAVCHGTDVGVDAENFLNDNQPSDGIAGRTGYIGAEFVPVQCFQSYKFAHGYSCCLE